MDDVLLVANGVKAVFAPHQGMNLKSLQFGAFEVIDQTTKTLFNERMAGLGAMIGPHFHRRKEAVIPKLDLSPFPHVKNMGVDPFSHGIGRYAPWTFTKNAESIDAVLKGSDVWNGIKLMDIEAQDFTMRYQAAIVDGGLDLSLSVVSQADSLVGIHFYYALPEGKGHVVSEVAKDYIVNGKIEEIPETIGYDKQTSTLNFSLDQEADYTFHPAPNPLKGKIALKTKKYTLVTTYESSSSENSLQLWRPKDSFVCIEPLSAYDPRHPNLTVSSIKIRLELIRH